MLNIDEDEDPYLQQSFPRGYHFFQKILRLCINVTRAYIHIKWEHLLHDKKKILTPKYTNVLQGVCMNEWPIWTTKNVQKNPYEVYSNHYYIDSVM
jgi:hypothetical protein